MAKFKVGDKVLRKLHTTALTQERTGVKVGVVYTVAEVDGGVIYLKESMDKCFAFASTAFYLVREPPAWDVNEALRLRELAVQAIQEYNTYLLQQRLLEAIDIPPIK
ncbi:hypothetical protein NEBGPKAL_00042 [Klebsiella phage vB_KpP-Screen]|nr:hypothetical protein HIIECEMK_00014 [Klebsiella phage vB_KqP-Goliath]CAD5239091.1 hypothetical protein NEBGPKAL_00042 [Klebsiella phage vB_KpP-Screen]CAD5239428.1 hypothetical protein BLCJPOBP_00013 [Klebsiella phage vB_KpP-Yoda]